MSINISTMGLFQDCCGRAVGGGGAPPYRLDETKVKPLVLVKKVEIKDSIVDSLLDKIKVTLVGD